MPSNFAIGIDVGTHSIKVAQVRKIRSGLALDGIGIIPLGELAAQPDGKRKAAKVGLVLRDLVRDLNARGKFALTSLPGKRLFYRYVHVPPVPAWKLKALMEYEIEEENADEPGTVAYDYRLLELPTKAAEFTVLVAMAKNDVLEYVVDVVEEAGLHTEDIYPSATSVFNSYLYNHPPNEEEDSSIILNIGADNVDMVIQNYGRFFFGRSLTNGGNTFTESLQEEFNLPFTEAESLKTERGKILPVDHEYDEENPSYEDRISETLGAAADGLANAVQSSLMYCRAQLKLNDLKVDKLHLCGGGAKLPGLANYIGARLRMDVQSLNPAEAMDTSKLTGAEQRYLSEAPGQFTTAIGLALTKIALPGSISLSLLAEKEKKRRNFHMTDKYLYYAAACFLIGFGLSLYTSKNMSQEMAEKQTLYSQIRDEAKKFEEQLVQQSEKVGQQIAKVDALLLRANSSREITGVLGILTDPNIIPQEVNFTSIQVMPIQPVAFYENPKEPIESPTERILKIKGLVRTAIPPPVDPETKERPVPPPENYKKCTQVLTRLTRQLQEHDGFIYKAEVTRRVGDSKREEKGDPLSFEMSIELAPKTVEAIQLKKEFLAADEKSGQDP